jgi:hypothetical protein
MIFSGKSIFIVQMHLHNYYNLTLLVYIFPPFLIRRMIYLSGITMTIFKNLFLIFPLIISINIILFGKRKEKKNFEREKEKY